MSSTNERQQQQQQQQQPLAIEADAHNKDQDTSKNVLEVNGERVKLDALGPMIINSDGTMSRITNWQELSPVEQERTVRLLVKKRNLVRMRNIVAEGEDGSSNDGGDKVTALKEADEADAADSSATVTTGEPTRQRRTIWSAEQADRRAAKLRERRAAQAAESQGSTSHDEVSS